MTPLLQALTGAARVGFDAPKCGRCWDCPSCNATGIDCFEGQCVRCNGTGQARWTYSPNGHRHATIGANPACEHCRATGLDASDPYALIGRAMVWLWSHHHDVSEVPRDCTDVDAGRALKLRWKRELAEHDGTPTGLATALLRLVARVGAPHPQTAPEKGETETP